MGPAERRELIVRLSRPVEELVPSKRWLRRWRERQVASMVVVAAVLVPWIGYLATTLPRRYVAANWDRTWVGFDAVLLALVLATAVLGWRRRQLVAVTAFATGMLLVCDAWFDVMTAHGPDRTWSLVTALAVELPLAALLVSGGLHVLRLVAARSWQVPPGAHSWQIPIPLPLAVDHAVGPRPAPAPEPRWVDNP